MESLDIFSYLDYREFCRDFYAFNKESSPSFSFRSFGRKAGVAPAYLKHVMDGKRNLSAQMSLQFARGMDLTSKQAEYFETLVRFNQATSIDEKNLFLEGLRRKRARSLKDLGLADAAVLLSHWYVVAIKELVVSLNCVDVFLIQRMLKRRLSEVLISKTIDDLKAYGWIEEQEGRWVSRASEIRFPDEVRSYVVRSFHRELLDVAQDALDDPLEKREFGSMVFTFPPEKIGLLKERVKQLQRDLVVFLQEESGASEGQRELMVVSLQCFSLLKENV